MRTERRDTNGHHATREARPPGAEGSQALSAPVTARKADDATERTALRFHQTLFEHGRARAKESGALSPDSAAEQALSVDARAMAREAAGPNYDPGRHAADQIREAEYKKAVADRKVSEEALRHAEANLREREADAAGVHVSDPKPAVPAFLEAGVVGVIGLSTMPALHDILVAGIDDDVIGWLVALVGGLAFGFMTTRAILGSATAPQTTAMERFGLFAGIGLGVALGILRLSTAQSTGGVLLAVACSGIEIAAVLFAESVARGVRAATVAWSEKVARAEGALAKRAAAQKELDGRRGTVALLEERIKEHLDHVSEKETRHLGADALEAAAVGAVLDGYHAGVSENRGRVLGVKAGVGGAS